jgi:hypothetical protein
MFPLTQLPNEQIDLERARSFVVDDVSRVPVPGLRLVERVFVDGVEVPVEETRNMASQDPGQEVVMRPVLVPIVALEYIEPVGACLVRSVYSNDGRWHQGSTVTVVGEWDEDGDERMVSSKLLDEAEAAVEAREKELADLRASAKESERLRREVEARDAEIARLKASAAATAPTPAPARPRRKKG